MDSSHVLGSSKNLSGRKSIESGWTDYIGSSFQERYSKAEDYRHNKKANHKNTGYGSDEEDDDNDDGESDDSMVSDASSGPSHSEVPEKKAVLGRGVSKHTPTSSCCSRKDQNFWKQRDEARIKVDEDECMLYAKSAASHNGLKVGKIKKMEVKREKV
ncbi:hypothetical protein LINGRAHAP2_LOCUS27798 [Linum grandiflorum]